MKSGEISYPFNRMNHAYSPRDEFEFINWGWAFWDNDVVTFIPFLLDDVNWS